MVTGCNHLIARAFVRWLVGGTLFCLLTKKEKVIIVYVMYACDANNEALIPRGLSHSVQTERSVLSILLTSHHAGYIMRNSARTKVNGYPVCRRINPVGRRGRNS